MARLRYNLVQTTLAAELGDDPGDTTITFTAPLREYGADDIATIGGGDILVLRVDNEILHVTAYTSGATTATVTRAEEDSTIAIHALGSKTYHLPTKVDFLQDVTQAELDTAIADFLTETAIDTAISTAISAAIADFLTSTEIDTVIGTAIADFLTDTEIATLIATAISPLQDATEVGTLITAQAVQKINGGRSGFENVGNVSGTVTLDLANGNVQRIVLTGNITTFAVTGLTNEADYARSCTLIVVQDGTGSRTIDWDDLGTVQWPAGTEPVLSTAAGAVDIVTLMMVNSTLYGFLAGKGMA